MRVASWARAVLLLMLLMLPMLLLMLPLMLLLMLLSMLLLLLLLLLLLAFATVLEHGFSQLDLARQVLPRCGDPGVHDPP
jgi:hypothetical protein